MRQTRKSNIIAALDIGNSKIACFIALKEPMNKLRIIGIGHQISQGISAGVITDVQKAENAILAAISAAEQMSGQTIEKAVINVSGNSIKSHNLHVGTSVSGHEITNEDINHILAQTLQNYTSDDKEIIHCIPTSFNIDDAKGIKNPRGMFGDTLATDIHLVSVMPNRLKNTAHCLATCRLDIEDCIVPAYASGLACLTEDEKELGSIVIDIGGGITAIGAFIQGNLIYTTNLPLGGVHITKDLARGLCTSISYAERIKTIHGTALNISSERNETIDIPIMSDTLPASIQDDSVSGISDESEVAHITKSEIVSIINPRIEEILEIIKNTLDENQLLNIVGNRIILTGGTSQLGGIKNLAETIFGKHVRIGRPFQIDGMAESTKGAAFSCCIGMLKYIAGESDYSSTVNTSGREKRNRTGFEKILGWFEDNI